jgi:glycosyltransferase involved in cell wall biosynthesis
VWQRPLESRRVAAAPLLVPMSHVSGGPEDRRVVVPPPVDASGPRAAERDIAVITYASDPVKKGLDRVLAAWDAVRREGEELVVVTEHVLPRRPGVRVESVRGEAFRTLVRRSRVYAVAPRREDFGIAQLEALADGCLLVTTDAPGPYEARELARRLDPRLVGDDLARALRTALDDPAAGYAERARRMLEPYSAAGVQPVTWSGGSTPSGRRSSGCGAAGSSVSGTTPAHTGSA